MSKNPSQREIDIILKHYKAGRFKEVKQLALNFTDKYPYNQFGWKALGIAFKQAGNIEDALMANKKSLKINSLDPEAHYNLGNTYKELGRLEDSEISYKKAIGLKPDYAAAYNNLADIYRNKKQLEQSEICYKKAIELNSNYFEAYNNLAVTLRDMGKLEESENNYKKAIDLNPKYFEAYSNLGITLREMGRLEDSENSHKKAIELNPKYFEAYSNLGITLREMGRLEDSKNSYKTSIRLNPDYAEGYFNLGVTLRDLGNLEDSKSNYEKAISIKPNYPEAYNNLGVVFREIGNLDKSEYSYKKAINLKPDYADAYNNLSFTLLLKNDFKKAYDFSEWRWSTEHNIGKKFITTKPLWNGESGKRVLAWKEQGIGDEIMHCSMLSELKAKSKKLVVHCDKRLIPIFKRSLSDDIIYESDKMNISDKDYDAHIPLGSISKYFRNDLRSFAVTANGYLKANKEKAHKIRSGLIKNNKGKLIGISWYTKSRIQMASFRNIMLSDLASVLNNSDTKLVNLQYDDKENEIKDLKNKFGIELIQVPEVDNRNDIDGLASLISACDFVVSIDNFTVHLAGSLGVKTKILLPYTMDARWGLKGKESYLYDSVSLYRQTELGNWKKVLKELSEDI